MNKRLFYIISFIALFIVEAIIALYIDDNFIRPYIGDVLVVVLLYCFVRIIIPTGIKLMPLYVFIFAALVEFSQYFEVVKILGLENNKLAKVVIGSVFDWKDIICYGVGCLGIGVFGKVKKLIL